MTTKIIASTKQEVLGEDPPIVTYLITLEGDGGVWHERYTKNDLDIFLRGVTAGAALCGGSLSDERPSP